MKIAATSITLLSDHREWSRHEVRERLRVGSGTVADPPRPPAAPADPVAFPAEAATGEPAVVGEDVEPAFGASPKFDLLRLMIEHMTGRPVRVFDARDLRTDEAAGAVPGDSGDAAAAAGADRPGEGRNPAPRGPEIEYTRHESLHESEATAFAASGTVVTEDGREIDIALRLDMQRSHAEASDLEITLGKPVRKDPLVINFGSAAATLSGEAFDFDLDADGRTEGTRFLGPGSGYLALDRNGDGRVGDGRELFGPTTGNGFAELAELDGDRNGWIDENDPAYGELAVWTRDGEGNDRLAGLATSGIGAIGLASIATPFALRGPGNAELGEILSTGLYLRNDGSAGSVQQIDLVA